MYDREVVRLPPHLGHYKGSTYAWKRYVVGLQARVPNTKYSANGSRRSELSALVMIGVNYRSQPERKFETDESQTPLTFGPCKEW